MTKTFDVTPKIIATAFLQEAASKRTKSGNFIPSRMCPVAAAIATQLKPGYRPGVGGAPNLSIYSDRGGCVAHMKVAKSLDKLISAFDRDLPVEPMRFEADVQLLGLVNPFKD